MLLRNKLRNTALALSLAVTGLTGTLASSMPASTAHASAAFGYQSGYSVQNGWLCYGWSDGSLHCTSHWYISNGQYVSDNTGWVPNGLGSSPVASQDNSGQNQDNGSTPAPVVSAPAPQPAPVVTGSEYTVVSGDTMGAIASAHGVSLSALEAANPQVANPNLINVGEVLHLPSGSGSASAPAPTAPSTAWWSFKPSANPYPWGQCTWGSYELAHDNVAGLGNAKDWIGNARARGMATGTTPRVGATVVYQAGVQGASYLGHVAHVTQVFADGSFEVREMNYYGFGGGFGIFSYRHSFTGWGVDFIY